MIPQLVYGAYAAAQVYQSYRYWSDYEKNTGMHIRYPLRTLSKDIAPIIALPGRLRKKKRPVYNLNRYITNRNTYNYSYQNYL